MINLKKAWLPQLIGYAELITNTSMLDQAWLKDDHAHTSVTSYQELFEQLFGDMQADHFVKLLPHELHDELGLSRTAQDFVFAAHLVEDWTVSSDHELTNAEVLRSKYWKELESSAFKLLAAAKRAGISSADFDPS